MHRRAFVLTSLAAAGAAAHSPRAMGIDPIPRPGGALLKLSIAAYGYRDFLTDKKEPHMTLEDFALRAARMGLSAIEPTSYYFKDTSTAALMKFKGLCTRLGLDISGGAVGNRFTEPDPSKLREEIRKTKEWTERYALLGAKTMRIFAGNAVKNEPADATRRRCLEAIQEVCDHAAGYGVYMALENHGGIVSTPDQLLDLVQAVHHDWFGVNLDSAHFHTPDPYAGFARVAPYAVTVQLKTEIQRGDKEPKEPADLARYIGILRSTNYRGYVALEYEAVENPLTAIPRHIQTLQKLMKE